MRCSCRRNRLPCSAACKCVNRDTAKGIVDGDSKSENDERNDDDDADNDHVHTDNEENGHLYNNAFIL